MPTPVSTARQCLTEESARVLDDAVAVARRRYHAQTTSLHAVSALLSLPSSILRDACSRARSPAYPSRFQFRALDLCVSVSLDRLQSSKSSNSSDDDPPPVSNSLMAAIKRSQASQRRQPEMYQITQHTASSIYSISSIKVELKNFVISVLDDPIVSRVLGDAGFRSTDIKLAILHPPAPSPSARYLRGSVGRCPPLFLCNLTDSRPTVPGNIPFPFSRADGNCDGDENCRRIGEILVKSSGRNPLLVGVCARDALANFKKRVENRKVDGVLPSQIAGLDLICVENEITEFVSNGGSKEAFDLKVEEWSSVLERHSGPGVVVNFGELKVLMEAEGGATYAVKCLVSKLSTLFKIHKKKMWLIGAAADYETYRKFLDRFPSLEVDWDLHPLPITSSGSSTTELSSKSSLMGSFVPFGGFFSTITDYRSPLGVANQPFIRCGFCSDMYERELSAIKNRESSVSVADQHSSTLPSWLQTANSDAKKAHNVVTEIPDEKADSNANVLELQKKWDDICQRLHRGPQVHDTAASMANAAASCTIGLQFTNQRIRNGSLCSDDGLRSNLGYSVSATVQNTSLCDKFGSHPKSDSQAVKSFKDHVPSSSISCVTTDLGLATSASNQIFPHSSPMVPEVHFQSRDSLDQGGDYKLIVQKLTEKVAWQLEACYNIGQIISRRRGGNVERCASDVRHDTWIGFTGPDKIGKRIMAEALADLMFGSKENLIAVDLSVQETVQKSHFVFHSILPDDIGLRTGRKTVVDYIAGELSKKPCSVVFLENVDKTDDPLIHISLSNAIRTGRFPDSHGREISIVNAIFLIACNSTEENQDQSNLNSFVKFSERSILEAFSWQMQVVTETTSRCNNTSTVTIAKGKRKQNDTDETFRHKKPKGVLDLNMPFEEEVSEVEINIDAISDSSRSWLQHFLKQLDKQVAFKPFNFDALANKLLNKMSMSLQRSLGSGFRLEVDQEVMSQVVAAALCSDGDGPIDDWIKEVLNGACAEAQRRYSLHEPTGLKLVSCPGVPVDNQAPRIRLPRMINLG